MESGEMNEDEWIKETIEANNEPMFAVFKGGKQISKLYPLEEQAIVHAVEKGYLMCGCGVRFGVEIREVK